MDVENLLTYDVDNPTTEILDLIFVYGQNDKQPREHPSVSVGDVIHLPTSMWLILPLGFKKLSRADYKRYTATPQNQRAVSLYLNRAISNL